MWASPSSTALSVPSIPAAGWRRRRHCRAELSPPPHGPLPKKVVVFGAGWAGFASAHHLIKQGFDVTLLEAGIGPAEEIGVRGFWYPYRNIFSVVDELGVEPFTKWTKAAFYSPEGIEVELPIFQDLPRLPAPLGALIYPQFPRLPLVDRLTPIPLMAAVIDFDNTDMAWRKYDAMTSRELFKQFGCSRRLYQEVFGPVVQVGLFAPGEQCSAAATLGMLYYYVLSHQQNFDVVWCRGTVEEKILSPWLKSLELKGLKFHGNRKPTDFIINEESGCISGVACGQEIHKADAFILAVGVSALQSIITSSPLLQTRQEFMNVLKLDTIDVVSVKLWLDRKVKIPNAANVCYGFDDSAGWTFFDLSSIYDDYDNEAATVLETEIYNASQLLPLKDEQIVANVMPYLRKCIPEFQEAVIVQQMVVRCPMSATHFSPGSYRYMMRGSTSFPNLFMAGDWIVNRHGSWSKEKAYVTGLEAANRVVDFLGEGNFAKIIAVEEDEPHIEALRNFNRRANEIRSQLPLARPARNGVLIRVFFKTRFLPYKIREDYTNLFGPALKYKQCPSSLLVDSLCGRIGRNKEWCYHDINGATRKGLHSYKWNYEDKTKPWSKLQLK
ncbi:uncharacterized protein LOC109707643 isoform X3 [Ananas comosus]|uniref:Uncharacterized protein LOC109707643 isoform X3 n=1 Tax=Ananas comosus TaxID=4615 RepID=A0A6P5ETK9_ANACO|nr:uncharacterized protein LOC109707643 isoform X3 [Ananas comosus]